MLSAEPVSVLTHPQEEPLAAWNEQLTNNQSYENRDAVWW